MKFLLVISCAFALSAADVLDVVGPGGNSLGRKTYSQAGSSAFAGAGSNTQGTNSRSAAQAGARTFTNIGYSAGDASAVSQAYANAGARTNLGSTSNANANVAVTTGVAGTIGTGTGFIQGEVTGLLPGNSGYLDYSSTQTIGGVSVKVKKPVIVTGVPVVSKAFYIHAAPPDPVSADAGVEEVPHVVHPRKHYNIVFVRTPLGDVTGATRNNLNVFPDNEEKTIIYVLNGRNDGLEINDEGKLALPPPKAPSKPEVVFVKYNQEEDAQRAIADIQNQYITQSKASVSVVGAGPGTGVGVVQTSSAEATANTRSNLDQFGTQSSATGTAVASGNTAFLVPQVDTRASADARSNSGVTLGGIPLGASNTFANANAASGTRTQFKRSPLTSEGSNSGGGAIHYYPDRKPVYE